MKGDSRTNSDAATPAKRLRHKSNAQRRGLSPRLNMGDSVLRPCCCHLCTPRLNMGDSVLDRKYHEILSALGPHAKVPCMHISLPESGNRCLMGLAITSSGRSEGCFDNSSTFRQERAISSNDGQGPSRQSLNCTRWCHQLVLQGKRMHKSAATAMAHGTWSPSAQILYRPETTTGALSVVGLP